MTPKSLEHDQMRWSIVLNMQIEVINDQLRIDVESWGYAKLITTLFTLIY